MQTKKLVVLASIFLGALSMGLLIHHFLSDGDEDSTDISSEDNFKELINTDNSLLWFYVQG